MRPLAFRLRYLLAAALVVAGGAVTPAHAQWMDVATISSTIGNTLNRLCVGGGRTDLGCPADAPLLDTSINRLTVPTDLRVMGNLLVSGSQQFDGVTFANGGVSATGTISATGFSGDGGGITGIDFSSNPVDRIISGTAAVIAQQAGTVGLTLGGTPNAAYFHPTIGFVGPGVSTTGPISGTNGYFGGHVGIGTTAPSDVLDIQKPESFNLQFPIRLTQQSSDETGAAATGIAFKVAGTAGNSYFKSGIAFARTAQFGRGSLYLLNSNATDGSNVGLESVRMAVLPDGKIGMGTLQPSTTLHVDGTLRLANGGEQCDADRVGAIRFEAGQFRICRNGTTWEYMVAGGSGTVDADRITSGTTAVMAHRDASVTISTGGLERVTIGTDGNVGIGIASPDRPLTVQGIVSVTMLNLGSNGTPCTLAERGTIKYEGNKMFMCRD